MTPDERGMCRIMVEIANRFRDRIRTRVDSDRYWKDRTRSHGRRAVLNVEHAASDIDEVTDRHWQLYKTILDARGVRNLQRILDFGCGFGRFTTRLAQYGNSVFGVDRTVELLKFAPDDNERVSYAHVSTAKVPFPNDYFDMVWVNLVLGGVLDQSELVLISKELQRVLKTAGILFLAENTSMGGGPSYWRFRTALEYQMLFPKIALTEVSIYHDVGEEISVLVGAKR